MHKILLGDLLLRKLEYLFYLRLLTFEVFHSFLMVASLLFQQLDSFLHCLNVLLNCVNLYSNVTLRQDLLYLIFAYAVCLLDLIELVLLCLYLQC